MKKKNKTAPEAAGAEATAPVKKQKIKKVRAKAHEINLIKALRYAKQVEEKERKKGKPTAFAYILAALAVVGVGAWYGLTYLEKADLESENEDLEWQISDLEADYYTAKQLSYKNECVLSLKTATESEISTAKIGEAQLTYYDSGFFTSVRKCIPSSVTITSISFNDTTLDLSFTASKNTEPAETVSKLRASGLFDDVEYSGFSSDGEGGVTTFSVTCTVKQTAEAEEAE